jgi:hypothetical protein
MDEGSGHEIEGHQQNQLRRYRQFKPRPDRIHPRARPIRS